MKKATPFLCAVIGIVCLAGCGQDRSALARTSVQQYWYDISHARIKQAYGMLTSGTRAAQPYNTYSEDMLAFLAKSTSLSASVGKPAVHGDEAAVPITLKSIVSASDLHACQHLFWENGAWKISDQNGGLSHNC